MSEYDKKIEEIKEMCRWFNEHQNDVMEHGDGIILAAVYGESRITNIAVGDGELVANILAHLVHGCHENWQKRNVQ